ncbi:MAG: hypothetical protein ACR2MQ_14795 [Gemmatimonadaceae bacterium]
MFGFDAEAQEDLFANVVSVTFSAFDPLEPLAERKAVSSSVRYSCIGLQRPTTLKGKVRGPKSPGVLRGRAGEWP